MAARSHQNVILTVATEEVPRLRDERRVTVEKLSERFSRVTVKFGFMEDPNVPKALEAANFNLAEASFFLSRGRCKHRPRSGCNLAGLPVHSDGAVRERRL